MTDWDEVRRAYIEEGESLRSLSERFKIPYNTLRSKAGGEKWKSQRETETARSLRQAELVRVGRKLLRRIENCLDEGKEIDLKELKAVTGALKELQSLQEGKDSESGESGRTLTVRFLGETEEMSV